MAMLVALTTAGSCNSEALFKSNFDATAINQPPAANQAVGTASVDGPPGSVVVVAAPPNAQPSGKWLQVSRQNGPTVSSFQGKLKQQPGNGTYVFSAAMFMPTNSGIATVQFEPFNQPVGNPVGFLHLDFMPDNRVRIDDESGTLFGHFPRDQVFIVQVTLTINATEPKAHILLSGAGASGEADRIVPAPLRFQAQQFGAVRIWMGFPNTGTFQATNVVVTKQ